MILILFSFFVFQPVSATSANEHEILYINSYHHGHDWSDGISEGIFDYFKQDKDASVYTEYMDTKQYPKEEHLKNLYTLYHEKYKNRDFDAIITSDDNALNFVLKYKDTLFPGTPVVFCGVNEVPPDFQEIYPNITGILEYIHIKDTIEMAIDINPSPLKRIYLLTDNSETGFSYRNIMDRIKSEYKGDIEFVDIYDISINELLFEASNMPDDSAILYVLFNRDNKGDTFTNKEAVSLISEKASVPVYAMIDNIVGSGPAGGVVMSPYSHGYLAAKLADEIINGKKPSEIKIEQDLFSYPEFDFKTLNKFGYDLSKLPENSTILNKPDNTVKIPFIQYLAIVIAATGLFVITILLVISNRKLRITGELLKTSEERLSIAMQATKDGIWDFDIETRKIYVSPAGYELLGYDPKSTGITDEMWKELIHPEDKETVTKSFMESRKKPGKYSLEYRIKTNSGKYKWIREMGNVTEGKNNPAGRIVGIFSDIDETVMYRNALLESNKKLSILSSVTRHDILNQVTALFGYIEIMKEIFEDNKSVSEFIPKLTRPVEVIQQQINFTRDYEEMGHLEPKWQNLATVAKRAAVSAGDDNTEITIDTGNTEVYADNMLEKVFYNLFDNTKRHSGSATKINVSFKVGEDNLGIITVEDNGKGIENEKKEEIFKKGYGGNSGYGLFLISNILDITGIKIQERGVFGKGAKFEMIVPENMWHIPADINDL
ncbi:MAG: ABC transporter substrate binding protein [Methanomicrobium sp.]|nr:ABC transporter substrate binding protein [Methanomicrobium sp.]